MVIHRDDHRNEHDCVVEEVQFDARHPHLHDARRHGSSAEVIASGGLRIQQEMFEVVEELNRERDCPPPAIFAP